MSEPRKKAEELVEKFEGIVLGYPVQSNIHIQCAILCVKEIIKANPIVPLEFMLESESLDAAREFWNEVLTELNKM